MSFHNKHDGGSADNVAIAYEDLVPVPGAYKMTKEEFDSLMSSEPMDVSSMELTDEEHDAAMDEYDRAEEDELGQLVGEYSFSNSGYYGTSLADDPRIYTYDFLVSQPDMSAVLLPDIDSIRGEDSRIDTSKVVAEGMKNALSVGQERAGKIYVVNRYTGRELRIDVSSIRHGLNGGINRILTNARLGCVIGDVVQNAIPINALHNTSGVAMGTYAMAGYAVDDKGREFVAIITVEQRSNSVSEIDVFDVTHAVSGRQNRGKLVDTKSQGVYPSKLTSTISINDLLLAVKSTYRSILSNDVLSNLGEQRNGDGYYAGKVKFSYSDNVAEQEKQPLADFLGQYVKKNPRNAKKNPRKDASITDDEPGHLAHEQGYPVIDGVQVIPFQTWVHCTDPYRNEDGSPQLNADGSVRRRNNYGLVIDKVDSNHLVVSFNNKGLKADGIRPGEILGMKRDDVIIATEYLTPERGKYQMTASEWDSLENAEPVDIENWVPTAEEEAEMHALFQRSSGERTVAPTVKVEDLPRKAQNYMLRVENRLLRDLAERMGVSKFVDRTYLKEIVEEIATTYLQEGTVSDEKISQLFDKAYDQGVVVDKEFYEEYRFCFVLVSLGIWSRWRSSGCPWRLRYEHVCVFLCKDG